MLTNTEVKNLKIEQKVYYVKDSLGLRIQINPCGSKIWQHRFRIEGKQKIRNGGEYPATSLHDARQWRDKNKRLIKQGIIPPKVLNRTTIDNNDKVTFNDMFVKWHNNQKDEWSTNYAVDVQHRTNMYLLPFIGNEPIDGIKTSTMRELLLGIQDKGIIDTVQKVKGIASRVFSYSVGMGVININPVRDLPNDIFKKKSNKHFATITEPKKISWLLGILKQHSGSDVVKSALDLAPHVFLRPTELTGLMWTEIDFDNRLIRIDSQRMKMKKPHLVPMSKQVFEMLWNLSKIDRGSPFVFPSPRSRSKPITANSLLVAMRTLGIDSDTFTTHGFRHMASTRLNELGFNRDVIESQLAHKLSGVRGVYNQAEYLDERKNMMQAWSDYLDNLQKSN